MILIFALLSSLSVSAESIRLSPDQYVRRVLGDSLDALDIGFEKKKSDYPLAQARAVYDWTLSGEANRERTRYESISGLGNYEDKNKTWTLGVTKKLPTGTTIGLSYYRLEEESKLRSSSTRSSFIAEDIAEASITQDLMPNFFGIADRMNVNIAKLGIQRAEIKDKRSRQDLALAAMKMYWNTFVSFENMTVHDQARKRASGIVEYLEKKSKQGFINPGELPKARAEYEIQLQQYRESVETYNRNFEQFLSLAQIEVKQTEVIFKIPEVLPKPPTISETDAENLSGVSYANLTVEAAKLERRAARLASLPKISIVGKAGLNGVGTSTTESYQETKRGEHPRYLIGVQFTYLLDSDKYKGERENKENLYDQAVNQLVRTRQQEQIRLSDSIRSSRANYDIAKSAMEGARQLEIAVREREKSFHQGRIDTTQIIADYNGLASAQSARLKAIGEYYLARSELLAAQDKLLPGEP